MEQMEISKEEAKAIRPQLITKILKGNNTGLRATKKEYLKAVDKSYKIIKTEKNVMDQIDTYDVYCKCDGEEFMMSGLVTVMR